MALKWEIIESKWEMMESRWETRATNENREYELRWWTSSTNENNLIDSNKIILNKNNN